MDNILKAVFQRQLENNNNWVDTSWMSDGDKEELLKDYILLIQDELMEMLKVVNYKRHVLTRKPLVVSNVLEEVVDVFKYLVSICLLYGFTPDEFIDAFYKKSDVVDDRWQAEQTEWLKGAGILCVDIDGVLAEYGEGYERFLIEQGAIDKGVTKQDSYNFSEVYGLSKDIEEMWKRRFQEGGGFLDLPVVEGAIEGLKWAKECGYIIVLISARPYIEIKRIHSDTIEWLKKNGVLYDAIFWGKDKADIVFSKLPIKPIWFIEDRDKHAIELANEGISVLLIDKPYNQDVVYKKVFRVNGWKEISTIIGQTALPV